jgi:hypothetical protein
MAKISNYDKDGIMEYIYYIYIYNIYSSDFDCRRILIDGIDFKLKSSAHDERC